MPTLGTDVELNVKVAELAVRLVAHTISPKGSYTLGECAVAYRFGYFYNAIKKTVMAKHEEGGIDGDSEDA